MHSKGTRSPDQERNAAAYAVVLVLDLERRSCPLCGTDGLCGPLTAAFLDATDVIIVARVDQGLRGGGMSDVFTCDYCRNYAPLSVGIIFYGPSSMLPDGRWLCVPAVYCSPFCGRTATARAGAGRG